MFLLSMQLASNNISLSLIFHFRHHARSPVDSWNNIHEISLHMDTKVNNKTSVKYIEEKY